ncbi:uncharacterized protein EKO05_0006361 [Ascochyta rabiei]|nr:uncharacterized protein EKO05_0006361 [Ascochyta rabiei]UPX15930.1 hypothetical protein EKO05_0006361 [Ascochyta rabiei]
MTPVETLPLSTSQTSATSGATKRVLSHGQHVVLNSDSDSDSMAELDFGLPAPKLKIQTHTGRPSRRTGRGEQELRRPPKEGRKSAKRPFSQLMETAQKNLDAEREIQERKADLERVEEQTAPVPTALDKDTLEQAINDAEDPDQADRLFKAMQRTNQARAQTAYHFFGDTHQLSMVPSFPQKSLPDRGWTACFEVPSTRDQAFMTGFAHQIFRLQELPKELAAWMIDQICLGRDAALDQKYLEILKTHEEHLQKLLSPKRLDVMFKSIGAQVESLSARDEISMSEAQADGPRPPPPSLKRIAALLTTAAPWLHARARIHAFHLLCYTCLDDRVVLDADVLNSVQDAMEAIICQYADNHKLTSGVGSPQPDVIHSLITSQLVHVIPKLLSRVTNPLLQANLIHAFPTRSPLTAYLQRYLALSFLLYPTSVDVPLADAQLPDLIHTHLETSPHYRMNQGTDYSFLTARLALLDIAIGPGPLNVPYMPLVSPPPSEAGSSPFLAPTPGSSEVKVFNRAVDVLAQHIKLLGNSIVETGATLDLTILEAKERCERVYWRLQHAVRIGGKKADDVFGDDEEERQTKIRSFLKPFPKNPAPKVEDSIFDGDGDTGVPT